MTRHSGYLAALAAAFLLPVGAVAADTTKPAPAAAAAKTEKTAKDQRQCPMPTSSRLQKKDDDCAQAKEWTRSYSNGELKSTGQTDAMEALRRLDPRVH